MKLAAMKRPEDPGGLARRDRLAGSNPRQTTGVAYGVDPDGKKHCDRTKQPINRLLLHEPPVLLPAA
jgi:hypothetical protein